MISVLAPHRRRTTPRSPARGRGVVPSVALALACCLAGALSGCDEDPYPGTTQPSSTATASTQPSGAPSPSAPSATAGPTPTDQASGSGKKAPGTGKHGTGSAGGKKHGAGTKPSGDGGSGKKGSGSGAKGAGAGLAGLVASSSTAAHVLGTLTVRGKAPMTGYDRDGEYGPAWKDVDHNGCDTRNDVLDRDLSDKTYREGTHFCLVTTGTLVSPYTGETIHFVRGNVTSMAVQIDHVVALANSWVSGAQRWDQGERERLANDPLNLLAVDGTSNQRKSANDASGWLPARTSFRCTYVALQISVKAEYGLSVTAAEKAAMQRVLDSCPGQTTYTAHPVPPKPTSGRTTTASASGSSSGSGSGSSGSSTTPSTKPSSGGSSSTGRTDPRYGTCGEAISHGYGPYARGEDREYSWYRDADHDGVVCES